MRQFVVHENLTLVTGFIQEINMLEAHLGIAKCVRHYVD